MEQKAVTYKTIKGMSRDMAVSSGSNDYSYENYNIRITTRGKEDSLVVTNEKGTESNIIATRDVLKTVNNVFVGMQPDFYNNYSAISGVGFDYTDSYDYTELYTTTTDEKSDGYRQITKEEFDAKHKIEYNEDSTITSENFDTYKAYLYISGTEVGTYIKVKDTDVFDEEQTYYRQSIVLDPTIIFYKKNSLNEITPLVIGNTDNGIIKFSLNTEYPTDSELVAKSVFKINENPITYDGEQYTLLNDGKYINDDQLITINAGSNYGYDTESIKEIVLNGAIDNGSKDYYKIATDVTEDNFNDKKADLFYIYNDSYVSAASSTWDSQTTYYYHITNEEIDDKPWLDSYKRLYKKITDNNFEFSGFSTIMNDIDYVNSTSLSLIPISIISQSVVLPTGAFKEGETYEDGVVGTPQTTTGDNKKVVADIPQLGYFTGFAFSNNYPKDTALKGKQISYALRIPILRKAVVSDIGNVNAFYKGDKWNIYETTDTVTESNVGKYLVITHYVEATFNFNIHLYFGMKCNKPASSITINKVINSESSISNSDVSVMLNFGFYSLSNPNSSCISYTVKGLGPKLQDSYFYLDAIGPFFENNINEPASYTGVPPFINGETIIFIKNEGSAITAQFNDDIDHEYIKCDKNTELPSGYSFGYVQARDVTESNFEEKKDDLYYYNGSTYVPATTWSGSTTYYYIDITTLLYGGDSYNIYSYEINKYSISSSVAISNIKTIKEENVYYSELTLPNATLSFNKLDNTIGLSNSNDKYYIYKITIDNHSIPYIIYTQNKLEDITTAEAFYFDGQAFSNISNATKPIMLPSDLKSSMVQVNVDDGSITKTNGIYRFGDDGSLIKSIERLDYLPIYELDNGNTTSVDSLAKEVFSTPPTYNQVVSKFGFKTNNFKSSIDVQSFRLKRSNNNWDDKFIYYFLSQGSDFIDYTRKLIPMSVLSTYTLSDLIVEYKSDCTKFYVNVSNPENDFFGAADNERYEQINITICDLQNKTYSKTCNLANLIIGVEDANLQNQDATKHSFRIKDIRESSLPTETDLVLDETKDIIQFEYKDSKSDIAIIQILKYQERRFAREIIDFGNYKFTSTIEFDFVTNYKNKFFSVISNNLLVSNFGDYHALTIPGRVLGSCTIDDYVVLFFHYSSPALNYYRYDSVNDVYRICPPNSIDLTNPDYYNLYTRNNKLGFDLAAKNGSLLRDDNNDYINGKNEDYIIKLKYIDARPDNDENEWETIVTKISNVTTQSALSTDVTMKRPYYSADILYHGNLGFNANNGIETIGYYESKDVIKVYFTDGKNQPRMIDIMTPLSNRNGLNKKWDSKSFDFIQEINGDEEYEITKQFGGGAFPAGTVQYYFTYTNLGGCETNPFICSPIYYTSQSDTGNSPLKITDNTFKIKLSNLSTRFDYVNIYSVVRTTKDMQTLCKKVINISLNGKTEIEFTDNNLLGEIVDSSYLLMLQGTPISALTMAEKDNTLFLGNINKLQKALTQEDKDKLKNCFEVKNGLREYQNYNPNEENWYENKVKDKIKLDYYGNEVKDDQGNNVIESKISLEENSSEIKTFMYNEYYRLGIQLQDKFGKWSDPIFIKDIKCDIPIETNIIEAENKEDKHKYVENIISKTPYFYLEVKDKDELKNILSDYEFIRIRPVIVYPNISSRNVLCQGLLNPTMFNYSDRRMNAPYNFASYFFRPMPPAISYNKDDSGNSYHNPNLDEQKVCGYPIEYRHGYPISGYHDAIEEGLAEMEDIDNIDDNTVKALVENYLQKQSVDKVKLTSNTIGWWVNASVYLREGSIILIDNKTILYKAGSKIYEVDSSKNKGDIKLLKTLSSDRPDSNYGHGNNLIEPSLTANKFFGNVLTGTYGKVMSPYSKCRGFKSHMHYFKNALAYFAMISWDNVFDAVSGNEIAGNEVIKGVGNTDCILGDTGMIFNEAGINYFAQYPVEIKFTPRTDIRFKKDRGLKRKTYFVDIVVKPTTYSSRTGAISIYTSTGSDGFIDDADSESAVAKKSYFAHNDGEIQCANGNKNYNFFVDNLKTKLDNTYNSSEIIPASRQQSLFYIDESICTLNSPEIEYDPTVQKIDLSTYKLNIIGAANITGYAQNVNIDTETPPATAGMTLCEGFKHENIEVQNFNNEAYRYFLSGGYWYDNVFHEGDDEEAEKKYDSADLISDQYCWWVYPFNRQILNNSKEGANGKLRAKQWYNYHYSAFNDYFGKSSIDYTLKDAQQIYGDFQATEFDNDWTIKKCMYFGSVDTAYTNPVPLVGILGGSNDQDENTYNQSLAISPHTKFKDRDSYSSATYADIVPLSFRSTNHFLLSFKGSYGKNRVLPEYYTNANLLEKELGEEIVVGNKEIYNITSYYNSSSESIVELPEHLYYVENLNINSEGNKVYKLTDHGLEELNNSFLKIYLAYGAFDKNSVYLAINDDGTSILMYEIYEKDKMSEKITFNKEIVIDKKYVLNENEFLDENFVGNKIYTNEINDIITNSQVNGCERPYVNYVNDKAGLYKYGHIYIAQLERGVKSADEVFSGTEESVLLQNTWIPAGVAINVNDVISGNEEIKYTEGDTFYQRYDCLKTFAYNEASVNQVMESLSTMIQTRINLDGIYSLRGNIDNTGANETNTNLLNTAYSQSDNYFTYSITDPYISQITEYSNMFTWTLTKQAMSRNDNWLAVNLIAYYNATGSFGKITRIINYRNSLFCFQDNAISQIAYNERVQLSPTDGVPIEIGNSGKVHGLNYISSNVGCQNRWSVCPSKGYLYWVDDRRAEIYRFSDSLEPFSTINGFSDWVKANTYGEDWKPILSTNVPITTYYDNNNDDIYFVTEKDCLAYNEKLNAFESFFSYEDSFILNSAGNTIVIKEQDALVKDMLDYTDIYDEGSTSWWSNGIRGDGLSSIELMHEGEYNKFFGEYKPYYLRFKVYPTDLQRDKIYTNLEFNLDAFNEKDVYMPDDTFTRVRVWNEYQWGEMNFDNIYGTTSYKKRFRTWYLQLPRASYYPTGLYENYDYLYQRQLEWNYITSDVLADKTLAYYSYWNENSNCVNDRIRNPWVWMELYKNPKSSLNFEQYTVQGNTKDEKINNYLEKRNYLYYKVYVQVSKDDYDKYDILYNSTAEDAQPYTGDRNNEGLILYRLDYRNCANILTFDTEKVYYILNISNNRMEIHDIILKYFEA